MLSGNSRRLVSQQDASLVQRPDVPRSRFMGSWTRKTAFDAGLLVPIMVEEVLPGDHIRYDVTAFVRMATPLFPIMDQQRIDTFFFFVPNRLVWRYWPDFMGEQPSSPEDASMDLVVPTVPAQVPLVVGSLWDHMGLPPSLAAYDVNALPFRAYNLIWNEWFRDQNLDVARPVRAAFSSGDLTENFTLLRRRKAHDYFTSALPWPQKFTAPTINIGQSAPVMGIGITPGNAMTPGAQLTVTEATGEDTQWSYYRPFSLANGVWLETNNWGGAAPNNAIPQVYADLTQTAGITINDLRQSFMTQALLERDARGGTRYTEIIKSHFGAVSPDFRLQRPEYIGGGQTPLNITPVAQTAPDTNSTVGTLGAAGAAAGQHSASFAATEHGYIIGLINVRTELSYQHGLPKMWSRSTRYDFYWPSLAQLGEQAILKKELYMDGTATDEQVFGYQERWQEYRTRYSEVVGVLRSTAAGTLDAWHLAEAFEDHPTLSSAFIGEDPPMERVLAAGANAADQQYVADILFRRTAVRPLPTYGTPATLGRF